MTTKEKRKGLIALLRDVDTHLHTRDFDALTSIIQNYRLQMRAASSLMLVGVLRSTFCSRDSLPLWSLLLKEVRLELERRGQDADLLLMGLDDGK